MSLLQDFRNRPLNYTCVYDERKNRIVSVPRTERPGRHIAYTLLFVAITAILAGLVRMGVQSGLRAALGPDNYPWWATALDSTSSALVLVVMFLSVAPRLGMFPAFLGGKLELSDSATDKKLGILIKKNPRRLNIDWFKEWYDAPAGQQEKMYQQMRAALDQTSRKSQKKNRKSSVSS